MSLYGFIGIILYNFVYFQAHRVLSNKPCITVPNVQLLLLYIWHPEDAILPYQQICTQRRLITLSLHDFLSMALFTISFKGSSPQSMNKEPTGMFRRPSIYAIRFFLLGIREAYGGGGRDSACVGGGSVTGDLPLVLLQCLCSFRL